MRVGVVIAATDQPAQLERVSIRIGETIVSFCRRVMQTADRSFHMDELLAEVSAACGKVAPGSPDRVLRDLRAKCRISYRVISRRASLYAVEGVQS